ncbi:MAG TPA: 23S rRNA (uracil(1939)-C(5))-methyltransferase RlmD [Burkholderiaceae bacterium]|nr:23S rRNA (uracil(1939)-C(5))-methyltransferase RlmD [Burkholderiaceae bacterium]
MTELPIVEIESLDPEGRGVTRHSGKVVFVEGALPGERVRIESLRAKPKYETARAVEILRASSQRVTPGCPHFGLHAGACGGCSMQHLAPVAQVAVKQRILEDALWHIGRVRPQLLLRPIAGPTWGYRHRARLSVRYVAKKGGVLVGFHERRSSYVADMHECPVLPPRVGKLIPGLRTLFGGLSIRAALPQAELAIGHDDAGGERIVLVARVLQKPTAEDLARIEAFALAHAVEFWLQPGGPDTAHPMLNGTPTTLQLALPEHSVILPFAPTDFTQVNHRVNEVLVRRVVRLLDPRPDDRVVDFFCGLGNFTLPLARRAGRVLGIEGNAALLERAAGAAAANGLAGRTLFSRRDLFEFAPGDWSELTRSMGGIGLVALDPPREGAIAVVQSLAAATQPPRRLVYVSCNPATLARDCAILHHDAGWDLCAAGVLNMFPHTSHVESIAVLEPGGRRSDSP